MDLSEKPPFPIDEKALIHFTREVVRCRSWNPPGDEAAVAALVADRLRSFGIDTQVVPVTPTRHNVYGRLPGRGTGRGHLLLVSHLDTVPPGDRAWEHGVLSGQLVEGRIYGRGAADMKGGLAATVFAAGALAQSEIRLSSDLIIAGTVGEEVDCLGAQALVDDGILEGVSAIGIPEPTGLNLYTAYKGALWVKIVTRGRTSHGARPDLGVNAILHMGATVRRILAADWDAPAHPLLGHPTLNVATIQGGVKTNMVPDRCELTIDFRTLPVQVHAELVARMRGILDRLAAEIPEYDATLEVTNDKAAVSTPTDEPYVQMAQNVGQALWGKTLHPQGVSYYTDASVLAPASGVPVIILGPGEAALAHQTDEWVSVEELTQAAQFYAQLASRWLA
jgi:succinyl-diaminopimelate desuccinylase